VILESNNRNNHFTDARGRSHIPQLRQRHLGRLGYDERERSWSQCLLKFLYTEQAMQWTHRLVALVEHSQLRTT